MSYTHHSQKFYHADDSLFKILNANGLKEFGNYKSSRSNKRTFKKFKNSNKKFYVDQGDMELWGNSRLHDSFRIISEEDMRLVIMFFTLNASHLDELMTYGKFKLKRVRERLLALTSELHQYQELHINLPRRRKIACIIEMYEGINT